MNMLPPKFLPVVSLTFVEIKLSSCIVYAINTVLCCYDVYQFRNFKIVYRRYAGLYFCICVDITDNNLAYLEAIHNFVEVLNEYFHNVCELDLVFNFYKVAHSFQLLMALFNKAFKPL